MVSVRRVAASLDMYRKVPTDLLEGTKRGSIMSYICLTAMIILFTLETRAFFSWKLITDLALDSNTDDKVRVNFNITMMDLKCDYATIDVVSVLGVQQNVTQHVVKYNLDADGIRMRYAGRNKQQNDILLKDDGVYESLEELHDDGEDAVSLDEETLIYALDEYKFVFIDFYASWCSHCRDLAPTWEVLGEVMTAASRQKIYHNMEEHGHTYSDEEMEKAVKVSIPVFVAKVDCVTLPKVCAQHGIRAYPTLKFFTDGQYRLDYRGHRTVIEMTNWLADREHEYNSEKGMSQEESMDRNRNKDTTDKKELNTPSLEDAHDMARRYMDVEETREEMNKPPERPDRSKNAHDPQSEAERQWREKMKHHQTRQKTAWFDAEHPGCQISGFLMVDRAPGNFHIQARSSHHDLAAHMTNVSHEVHHLSFGEPAIQRSLDRGDLLTPPGFSATLSPMDGNVYVTHEEHRAHHHYLKVITTDFYTSTTFYGKRQTQKNLPTRRAYQILQSSQLSLFRTDVVPEAKFSYDLSPIAVSYRKSVRKWYDYLTSIMAIIGGTFTVFGMLESGMYAVSSKKRR